MDIDNLDDLEIELPEEFDGLPVFAVGGVVRDTIRGVSSSDTDLMVAETTPQELKDRGLREIDSPNNDTFGVFQDSLGREVALAREESSTGDGHTDFEVTPVPPSVEAGEAVRRDLKRRDFTVNAMAYDLRWSVLIDPHRGVEDLQEGVIRAVESEAFTQDPLRILRGARFAARLNADIDPTTKDLMADTVAGLRQLPQERARMELTKALVEAETPRIYFDMLSAVGALEVVYPEVADLRDVPAGPEEYHKEGSTYVHTMMVLQEMKDLRPNDELALLMALAHDFGKAATPTESLPSHPNHGTAGIGIVRSMAQRLGMSNEQRDAMVEACRFHMRLNDSEKMRESTVIQTVQQSDNIPRLLDLTHADTRGREPTGEFDKQAAAMRFGAAQAAIDKWSGQDLIDDGYDPDEMGGKEFGDLLRQKRVEFMRDVEEDL